MQQPRAAQTTSARAASASRAHSIVGASGEHAGAGDELMRQQGLEPSQIRDIALGASRDLRSPLAALRVLLEGTRAGVPISEGFATRALEEIDRAEAAAHDILAWTMPRKTRATTTTLAEIVESLRASLVPADRRRTHFVVEQESTSLTTDAPILVESFERSLRHIYRAARTTDAEVMVHVHAADGVATFSFIQTGGEPSVTDQDCETSLPPLADALLRASVGRLGGRTSIHEAEGHRCAVITLPASVPTTRTEVQR